MQPSVEARENRDAEIHPLLKAADTGLPNPLLLDISSLELTDRQLEKLFRDNSDLQFEVTAEGELVIMAPTNSLGGRKEGRLFARIDAWAEVDGTGLAFGPSAGFRLPNGSLRAPDVSWILNEHWDALSEDEQNSSAPLCPYFVLELRSSRHDSLSLLQRKWRNTWKTARAWAG